jgi:hypothetical protein
MRVVGRTQISSYNMMRCLFCKLSSDDAKSIEHIVPESLGNTRHFLPRGAVCDRCNNYFARKIEGPLLSHPSFRNLRAWYQIPTKGKKLPTLLGIQFGTDINVSLRVASDTDKIRIGPYSVAPERASDRSALLRGLSSDEMGFAFILGDPPPEKEMSRLLAKMALEAHWHRFYPDKIERFIDEPHYDRIRNWARNGNNFDAWPFSSRVIYPEETLMRHPKTNAWVQVGFGFDLFPTERGETFFAFCLYGHEYVVNVGGPSIKGYEEWLKENNFESPLVERLGYKVREDKNTNQKAYYLEKVSGVRIERA